MWCEQTSCFSTPYSSLLGTISNNSPLHSTWQSVLFGGEKELKQKKFVSRYKSSIPLWFPLFVVVGKQRWRFGQMSMCSWLDLCNVQTNTVVGHGFFDEHKGAILSIFPQSKMIKPSCKDPSFKLALVTSEWQKIFKSKDFLNWRKLSNVLVATDYISIFNI